MNGATAALPRRHVITPVHGGRALVVAAATAVAGDHSIVAAIIVAGGGLLTLITGQITAELIRRTRRPPVDHHAEAVAEQAEIFDHMLVELVDERAARKDAESEASRLRKELAREKRGRRG